VKKYVDAFLVIIGLLIIVGTVIYYLFYNLNSTIMYAICGIVLVVMILLLYIRNYKNNHYGGKFKNDFPDAH
jgi:Flp pilus assembly protein TadB